MFVGGRVTVTRGVIYIPDPETFEIINTEDPAIFAVVIQQRRGRGCCACIGFHEESGAGNVDVLVNRGDVRVGRRDARTSRSMAISHVVLNPSSER
jgi:hypothetical protein